MYGFDILLNVIDILFTHVPFLFELFSFFCPVCRFQFIKTLCKLAIYIIRKGISQMPI